MGNVTHKTHKTEWEVRLHPYRETREGDLDVGADQVPLVAPEHVLEVGHDGGVHARQTVSSVHPYQELGSLPLRCDANWNQQVPARIQNFIVERNTTIYFKKTFVSFLNIHIIPVTFSKIRREVLHKYTALTILCHHRHCQSCWGFWQRLPDRSMFIRQMTTCLLLTLVMMLMSHLM